MLPPMPDRVTITTPQPPTADPLTGLEATPPPLVVAGVPARLSQKSVLDISNQHELLAQQNTIISLWTLLVPAGTVLTAKSVVVDQRGNRFEVVGQPVDRPDPNPQFRAAPLRLISDMQ